MHDEINPEHFIFFSPWSFLFIFLIVILGNLFIIDVAFFQKPNRATKPLAVNTVLKNKETTTISTDSCSTSCLAQIKKEIEIALAQKTSVSNVTVSTTTKEFFIPFGSGSSIDSEWTDIPGVSGYIDSSSYASIKKVTFEVSLNTPTGNQTAYARLYNVTDSHPVWNSEVTIEGGAPQLRISNSITLGPGSKLYQVQMKTQLGSRTNLENARVHIITN